MNTDQKAFLDAEETAEQLVSTLGRLKAEIESFDTAKSDLSAVRDKLERFIEASAAIGVNTQEIVRELKRIGGPELMERIAKVETTVEHRTARLQVLTILVGILALVAAVLSIIPFVR